MLILQSSTSVHQGQYRMICAGHFLAALVLGSTGLQSSSAFIVRNVVVPSETWKRLPHNLHMLIDRQWYSEGTGLPRTTHAARIAPLRSGSRMAYEHRVDQYQSESFDAEYDADVLIVGTGPVGAAFARRLLDCNHNRIIMVDVGKSLSR
jgi:hypothetical protein